MNARMEMTPPKMPPTMAGVLENVREAVEGTDEGRRDVEDERTVEGDSADVVNATANSGL
jgi:hypothetical protein